MMTTEGGDPHGFEEDEDEFLFNEYSIDDSLDSITRLERYHSSDFSLQRMVLVRDIMDTALEAGHEQTMKRLIPLLPAFVNDSEPAVRQALAEQIFPLAEFVCKHDVDGGQGYTEVLSSFVPFAIELLSDKNSDVGASAVSALLKVCDLIKPDDLEQHVVVVLQELAHDERAEEYRVVAAELCDELAPRFGRELCLTRVLPEVRLLADDSSFAVRKTVAAHIGKLCKTLGPEDAVEKVFPLYQTLSKDMIWGVRKACAESIASISEGVTPEVRAGELAVIFNGFIEDISRWVRVAASVNLGPYLYTFGQNSCPASLVQIFASMAHDEGGTDTDYPEYCAYNFPAVALTVGKDRWEELEPAFLTLVKDLQWKVRKTLSHSLHETAKIVGTEITERTLADAFELFLKDLDEVRIGCLLHVDEFLEVMSTKKRELYIPKLCLLTESSDSWRLRMLIGSTLGKLAQLVSPDFCKEHISPLCIKMVDDSVSDVRSAMFGSLAQVLKHLSTSGEGHAQSLLEAVLRSATGTSFQRRQILPHIAMECVLNGSEDLFVEHFLTPLCELARDPVANVRIVVAKAVSEIAKHPSFSGDDRVLEAIALLRQDRDQDVAFFAGSADAYSRAEPQRLENERIRAETYAAVLAAKEQSAEADPAFPPAFPSPQQPSSSQELLAKHEAALSADTQPPADEANDSDQQQQQQQQQQLETHADSEQPAEPAAEAAEIDQQKQQQQQQSSETDASSSSTHPDQPPHGGEAAQGSADGGAQQDGGAEPREPSDAAAEEEADVAAAAAPRPEAETGDQPMRDDEEEGGEGAETDAGQPAAAAAQEAVLGSTDEPSVDLSATPTPGPAEGEEAPGDTTPADAASAEQQQQQEQEQEGGEGEAEVKAAEGTESATPPPQPTSDATGSDPVVGAS
ncbi:Protein phosphatase PP2A regulatory subunit A [Diplonema papillatum]|nr:Protein phosphatase PP2A regulatory subunit A [Diplonema papillatum]